MAFDEDQAVRVFTVGKGPDFQQDTAHGRWEIRQTETSPRLCIQREPDGFDCDAYTIDSMTVDGTLKRQLTIGIVSLVEVEPFGPQTIEALRFAYDSTQQANNAYVDSILRQAIPQGMFAQMKRDIDLIVSRADPLQKLEVLALLSRIELNLTTAEFSISAEGIETTKFDSLRSLIQDLRRRLR